MTIVTWTGDPACILDHLPSPMRPLALTAQTARASLLINLGPDPEAAIEAATRFASWPAENREDRLIVNVLRHHEPADWPQARAAATLWAFTRHAALHWAGQGIRINAIGLGAIPDLPWQAREASAQPASSAAGATGATGAAGAAGATGAAGAAGATGATDAAIADCIMAMWRWRSMTGQIVRLGA
jgi:hypothetical protein